MTQDTPVDYRMLNDQLEALLAGEKDPLANTANFVALLWDALPRINWLGVYVLRGEELVLGPFQGKPACVRIPVGSGVCGTSVARGQTLRVADVHEFDGHIACDPASRSEIVVPLDSGGRLIGVLDIDSPDSSRFDKTDQDGIEVLCRTFCASIDSSTARSPGFI